jgi:hypothetical protein
MNVGLLLTSLLVTSAAALEKCNYAVVAPNLHSLATPIAKCMTATGNSYNLARAEAPPTPEQAAAICSKCADFVKDVMALPPWPECTLNVGGSDQTLTSYFDKMIGGCKPGGTSPTAAPAAPVSTPKTTETTDGSSGSGSPKGTVTSSESNGTQSAATVTNSPSATSTAPVPSPKSGAAATALASTAIAAAVSIGLLA